MQRRLQTIKRHPRLRPVWAGIKGALIVQLIIVGLGSCMAFGSPPLLGVIVGYIILFSFPLPFGVLGGILAQIHCKGHCTARAAFLGAVGTFCFMIGMVFYPGLLPVLEQAVWQAVWWSLRSLAALWMTPAEVYSFSMGFPMDTLVPLLVGAILGVCAELLLIAAILSVAYLFRRLSHSQVAEM